MNNGINLIIKNVLIIDLLFYHFKGIDTKAQIKFSEPKFTQMIEKEPGLNSATIFSLQSSSFSQFIHHTTLSKDA